MKKLTCFLLVFGLSPAWAAPVTINFDDPDGALVDGTWREDSMVLQGWSFIMESGGYPGGVAIRTAVGDTGGNATALAPDYGGFSSNGMFLFHESTSIEFQNSNGNFEGPGFTFDFGQTFSLRSLNICAAARFVCYDAGAIDWPWILYVVATGYRSDGEVVSRSLVYDDGDSFEYLDGQTVTFDEEWHDLQYVSFRYRRGGAYSVGPDRWEIDDIVVSVVPVPIPAAVWLFASGLAMLGWVRRRAA